MCLRIPYRTDIALSPTQFRSNGNAATRGCCKGRRVCQQQFVLRILSSSKGGLNSLNVCRPLSLIREKIKPQPHSKPLRDIAVIPFSVLRQGPESLQIDNATSSREGSAPSSVGREATSCMWNESRMVERHTSGWKGSLLAAVTSLIVLASPAVEITDATPRFSLGIAFATPLPSQLRQVGVFLERIAEGFTTSKVVDKVFTVFSSQTLNPDIIEKELKAVVEGEDDVRDELSSTFVHSVQESWSTALDLVTHFDPVGFSENSFARFSAFLETGAERFAAWEVSSLVAWGERWLIWTPLVVLPMAWQMSRSSSNSTNQSSSDGNNDLKQLREANMAKAQRVRQELERMELKKLLLIEVESFGEMALQPPRTQGEVGLKRRQIKEMMERLHELNPAHDVKLFLPEPTFSASTYFHDALDPLNPVFDGEWQLIYVSERISVSPGPDIPQIPGVVISNMRQRVWHNGSPIPSSGASVNFPSSSVLARNTAEIRFGPLGVLEIGVEGNWKMLKKGQSSQVSFETFSFRPLEILGNQFNEALPKLSVSLPKSFQQETEWELLYVDDHICINRGRQGQLFLFRAAVL